MKKSFNVILAACFISALSFIGCTKKPALEIDNETQSVVDNAIADQEFMAIPPTVQQHAFNSRTVNFKSLVVGCDTLTKISGDTLFGTAGHVDPVYTMTVSGCAATLADGKSRSGKLRIRMTGKLRNPGSKMIIKMQDYKSDGTAFSCDSMIVTTTSINNTSAVFNVKLINGVCLNSKFTIRYNFDRTITNSFASASPFISVYGTASGINSQNRAFTVNIAESSALIKHASCQFIDKGILELTPDGFKTRSVDFGDGTCDENATFSVNGNTVAFKLK